MRETLKYVSRLALTPQLMLLISTSIYFFPSLFAGVDLLSSDKKLTFAAFDPKTILVSTTILVTIVVIVICTPTRAVNFKNLKFRRFERQVLLALLLISGVYTVLTPAMYASDKQLVLDATDRYHYLSLQLCVITIISSGLVGYKNLFLPLILSIAGILFLIYVGHRSPAAFVIIGILYVNFRNKSLAKIGFLKVLLALMVFAFLTFYKQFYVAVKLGDLREILYIFNSSSLSEIAATGSEQFLVFSQLDTIVRYDVTLECSGIPHAFISIIPLMDTFYDATKCSFNSLIQPRYYSGYSGGVASNIWAEFYANFGFLGPFIFICIIVPLGFIFDRFLGYLESPVMKSAVILAIIQLTFYVQRNDLIYTFVLTKRSIVYGAIVFLIAFLLRAFLKRT